MRLKTEQPTLTHKDIIKDIMKQTGVTQTQLADRLGISQGSLATRLKTDVRLSNFEQILDALGYEIVIMKKRTED